MRSASWSEQSRKIRHDFPVYSVLQLLDVAVYKIEMKGQLLGRRLSYSEITNFVLN